MTTLKPGDGDLNKGSTNTGGDQNLNTGANKINDAKKTQSHFFDKIMEGLGLDDTARKDIIDFMALRQVQEMRELTSEEQTRFNDFSVKYASEIKSIDNGISVMSLNDLQPEAGDEMEMPSRTHIDEFKNSELEEMQNLIAKMDNGEKLTVDETTRLAELSKTHLQTPLTLDGINAVQDEQAKKTEDIVEMNRLFTLGLENLGDEQAQKLYGLMALYSGEAKEMTAKSEQAELMAMLENGTEGITGAEQRRLDELKEAHPQVYEDFLNAQYDFLKENITGVNPVIVDSEKADEIKELQNLMKIQQERDLNGDETARFLELYPKYEDEIETIQANMSSSDNSKVEETDEARQLYDDFVNGEDESKLGGSKVVDFTVHQSTEGKDIEDAVEHISNLDDNRVIDTGGFTGTASKEALDDIGIDADSLKSQQPYEWYAVGNEPEDVVLKKYLDDNFDSIATEINGIKMVPHSNGAIYMKGEDGKWQYKFINELSTEDQKLFSQVPDEDRFTPFFAGVIDQSKSRNEQAEQLLFNEINTKGFGVVTELAGKDVVKLTNEDGDEIIAEEYARGLGSKVVFRILDPKTGEPFKGEDEKDVFFVASKVGEKGVELEVSDELGRKVPTADGTGYEHVRISQATDSGTEATQKPVADSLYEQAWQEQAVVYAGVTPSGAEKYQFFTESGEVYGEKMGASSADPSKTVYREIDKDGKPVLDGGKEKFFVLDSLAGMANGPKHVVLAPFDAEKNTILPGVANPQQDEITDGPATAQDEQQPLYNFQPEEEERGAFSKFMHSKTGKYVTIGVVAVGLTLAGWGLFGNRGPSKDVASKNKADSTLVQQKPGDSSGIKLPGLFPPGGQKDSTGVDTSKNKSGTIPGILPGNGGTQNQNPSTGNKQNPITTLPGGRALGSDTVVVSMDSTAYANLAAKGGLWDLSKYATATYLGKYNVTDSTGKPATMDSLKAGGKFNQVIYQVVMKNTAVNNLGKRGDGTITNYDLWNAGQLANKPNVVIYEWDVKTALEKMGYKTVSMKQPQQNVNVTGATSGTNVSGGTQTQVTGGTKTNVSNATITPDSSKTAVNKTAVDSLKLKKEAINKSVLDGLNKKAETDSNKTKVASPDSNKAGNLEFNTDKAASDSGKAAQNKSVVDSLLQEIYAPADSDSGKAKSPVDTLKNDTTKAPGLSSSSFKRSHRSYQPLVDDSPAKAMMASFASIGLTSALVSEREKKRRQKKEGKA